MTKRLSMFAMLISMLLSTSLQAQETEVLYLSGTRFDQTVEWDFYCSDGMNSGTWTRRVKDGALEIELTFDFR